MTYDPRLHGFTNAINIQASNTTSTIKNQTGMLISKMTPVRVDTSGNMALIDVSSEVSALAMAGLLIDNVADQTYGTVVMSGKLMDVTVSASFGDIMYVDKNGTLTNIKPSEGVNNFNVGDFVVRVGVVVRNESNPLLKDLYINFGIVGQL